MTTPGLLRGQLSLEAGVPVRPTFIPLPDA